MRPSRLSPTRLLRRLALVAYLAVVGIGGLGVSGHGLALTSALAKGGKLSCAAGFNFCFQTSVDKKT